MTRLLIAFTLATASLHAADPAAVDVEFFEKKIRPLLAEHCYSCHGEKKQKGGLRLDSKAAILAGGDLGPAMVSGKPDESRLVKAVKYDGLEMPPKGKLPDAIAADVSEWVKRGAPWPGEAGVGTKATAEMVFTDKQKSHWSFQPITKPAVPTPKDATWAKTDIDRFIQSRLEAAALKPAPTADARTLARRLSFDLIGLPPEPSRVAKFEIDYAVNADASVSGYVAELLASPHYGERWGRHWLDVARYADSNGSEIDHAMANAWRYRDAVVKAFNADVPFDKFVRDQIAGDLIAEGNAAATGFLLLGPKALAELDKEKLNTDIVDEQVDTVTRAFLGFTVGCARCHDHKFDPIPTADYYALAGIFRSTKTMDFSKRVATWTERRLGTPSDRTKLDALRAERDRVAKVATESKRPGLAKDAKYLLVEAESFSKGNVSVDAANLGKGIGVIRTRLQYPDHIEYEFDLPAAGEYQLELRYAAKEARPIELHINGNLEEMFAADEVTGEWTAKAQKWFLQGKYTFKEGRNVLVFHRDGPVPLFDKWLIGTVLPESRLHSSGFKDPTPAKASKLDPDAAKKLKDLDAAIAAAEAEVEKAPSIMSPQDGPGVDMPILIRGNPATPGAVVPRGFPRIVNGVDVTRPGKTESGRRELAEWIAHAKNPLTARVIVNRVWLWHFGEGLVRSPDNFGLRGETPSHPELLDWLASRFVEDGGSFKKLHTLICTSAAYRQEASSQTAANDPENRLLSQWQRRRLDAEAIRDGMLAVGGNLDPTLGGSLLEVMNRTYATGGNAPKDIAKKMHYDNPRRSIYLPVIRNSIYDFFSVFDYPEPGSVTGQRSQTTVATQALYLMNSPFVRGQAKLLASRTESPSDAERVKSIYELALSRPPTAAEAKAAIAFLDRDAVALKEQGDKSPRAKAWERLCHAVLASNEFLDYR